MKITRNHYTVSYQIPDDAPEGFKTLLKYAVENYSFVMYPRTKFTAGALARELKKRYSLENPINRACYNALNFSQRWYKKRNTPE